MGASSKGALLCAIYKEVYGTFFDVKNFDQRIMLQKAVYLMGEMGVSCGDYRFFWDKRGPFSIDLSYDMRETSNEADIEECRFSKRGRKVIENLRNMVESKKNYDTRSWVEALASIRYLKMVMYPNVDDSIILNKLEILKPYLSDSEENGKALRTINKMEVV